MYMELIYTYALIETFYWGLCNPVLDINRDGDAKGRNASLKM